MRLENALFAVALLGVGALGVACQPPQATAHKDPGECATCHMPEYAATKKPLHVGQKPTACGVCHAMASWHPSRLDHPFWALTGAHETTPCFGCHVGTPPVFHGTSKLCGDCHRADFDRATFPGHAKFALTCEECHTTTVWKPSTWKTLPTDPTPSATATATTTAVPPPPPKKGTPRPKPKPTPSATPSSSPPDVVTRPSRR